MEFREIELLVGNVPFISKKYGKFLYDFIISKRLLNVLELGIAHGTATCYMAAALQELGEGSITSVDLIETKNAYVPSAEEQIEKAGLSAFVQIMRTQTGYTWFLHDAIRRNTQGLRCQEVYDLCIIDGPKNWTIDGAAFFFVDKLLKEGAWLIFDDYNWTYGAADNARQVTDGITHRLLSDEELHTPQIKEVFELLVKPHPNYSDFVLLDGGHWAMARKNISDTKTYIERSEDSYRDVVAKMFHRAKRYLDRAS